MERKKSSCMIMMIGMAFFLLAPVHELISGNTEVDSLLKKATEYEYICIDSSIKYAMKAFQLANELNDPNKELDALFAMVEMYIKTEESSKAMKLCDSANTIMNNSGLSSRYTDVQYYIGIIYQTMGYTSESLDIFLSLQRDHYTELSENNKIELFYYLAINYYEVGELEKCRDYLRQSMNTAVSHNLLIDAIPAYILYSNTSIQLDTIRKYLSLAEVELNKNPGMQYERVVLRTNQALLNKHLGNYEEARAQYQEAIRISSENSFSYYLAKIYNNYAYLLMAEANYDSARIVLDDGLNLAKKLNNADIQAAIFDSYSDYFIKISDYKSSHDYLDSSIVWRNKFREQKRIQTSQFLSAVFKSDQQEKAILLKDNALFRLGVVLAIAIGILILVLALLVYFRQRSVIIRSRMETMEKDKELELADAMISGQDSERRQLAMDLHDGMGARIGHLKNLVDGFLKGHDKYHELCDSISAVSTNVRELSHRMLPAHLEEAGLANTIRGFVSSINKAGRFSVVFNTNVSGRFDQRVELNLYYLVYELVNNAIKHSGGDLITVQLYESKDLINLSVEDNGGKFKRRESERGIGLKNIQTRVDYLRGTMIIEAEETETMFLIEIPYHKR